MGVAPEMWIYRDGRERRSGPHFLDEVVRLVDEMGRAHGENARRAAVEALIACGELESALADAEHPVANALATETDALAAAALGATCDARRLNLRLCTLVMPATIELSVPEGFAYYALHPEGYARAACSLRIGAGTGALVVGVRSIGTTLSAIACAALAATGTPATRFTVRPSGHPFHRRLDLDDVRRMAVRRALDRGATLLVVDEGPGISGSTLLATAEALVTAGASAADVVIVCSHLPDLTTLTAPNAATRFARFRTLVAAAGVRAPEAVADLSAGAWRARAYAGCGEDAWPASFVQTERRKLLIPGARLAKFEGLGRSGRAAATRADALAGAGLCAAMRDEGDGFRSCAWDGVPLSIDDLGVDVIDRMATYCAVRPRLCPGGSATAELDAMVAKNLELALEHVPSAGPERFAVERLCIVDGHMAPHEWLRRADRSLVKTDAVAHGDDHFFPGSTDIAWDLAGAIVEWRMDGGARRRLIDSYQRASGDDVRGRIAAWTRAYVAFRLGFVTVALSGAKRGPEHARLAREVEGYRTFAASSGWTTALSTL